MVQLNALNKCPKCGNKNLDWDVSDPYESYQFCTCGWRNIFGLEV